MGIVPPVDEPVAQPPQTGIRCRYLHQTHFIGGHRRRQKTKIKRGSVRKICLSKCPDRTGKGGHDRSCFQFQPCPLPGRHWVLECSQNDGGQLCIRMEGGSECLVWKCYKECGGRKPILYLPANRGKFSKKALTFPNPYSMIVS